MIWLTETGTRTTTSCSWIRLAKFPQSRVKLHDNGWFITPVICLNSTFTLVHHWYYRFEIEKNFSPKIVSRFTQDWQNQNSSKSRVLVQGTEVVMNFLESILSERWVFGSRFSILITVRPSTIYLKPSSICRRWLSILQSLLVGQRLRL